ncbi:MAG: helix-hairpin-helix domain-containing protein [Candidatus Paceibacterota bacterium]
MKRLPAGSILFLLFLLCFLPAGPVWAAVININTAGSSELQQLSGIGQVISGRIIDYRETNGPFSVIDDIKKVSGIGEVTFTNFKDQITVGTTTETGEGDPEDSNPDTETDEETDSSDDSRPLSAHTSPAPIITVTKTEPLAVSAGRERLVLVGSPVRLVAEVVDSTGRPNFVWTLGDGSTAGGREITHTYHVPGDYIVVLNAQRGEEEAVSRTQVKVIPAELDISRSAEYPALTVVNHGDFEVNLGGWSILVDDQKFILPVDTIIPADRATLFADTVTGLSAGSVQLLDPTGKIVSSSLGPPAGLSAEASGEILSQLAEVLAEAERIEARLSVLAQQEESQLALAGPPIEGMARPTPATDNDSNEPTVPTLSLPIDEPEENTEADINSVLTSPVGRSALPASVIVLEADKTWWQKMAATPAAGLRLLRQFFD